MEDNNDNKKSNRRDFLYISTAAVGAVTVGAATWPLINQMNPSADVAALSSIEVDLNDLEPGSQLTVKWLGKPVFIRRRTEEEISAARDVNLEDLPDKSAQNANLKEGDASDKFRTLDEKGEWLVMMGVCTHLGCVPLGDAGDFGGWFCPCHGSHYDTAGRGKRRSAPPTLSRAFAVLSKHRRFSVGLKKEEKKWGIIHTKNKTKKRI